MCTDICSGVIVIIRLAIADSRSWHFRHAAPVDFDVSIPWCASRRMFGANDVMQPAAPATAAANTSTHARRDLRGILLVYPASPAVRTPRARLRPDVAATTTSASDDAPAMSRLHASFAFVALVLGCTVGNSNIGTPCDVASDCGGGLICDVHDGKGTCQEPHDHSGETEGETEEDHATEHATQHATQHHATEHATDDPSTGHATEDHATEPTTGHATEHDHDTDHTTGA